MMTIINFKDQPEVKRALIIAAARAGYPNVSKFLSAMVRENEYVAPELKKLARNTKINLVNK